MIRALAALALLASGCVARTPPRPLLAQLETEGEMAVYLMPAPQEERRISFTLARLVAIDASGAERPLELAARALDLGEGTQRLVAFGRLPPGQYLGLSASFEQASLARDEGPAGLLLPELPTRIEAPFGVERGRSGLLQLKLSRARAADNEFAFAPVFSGAQRPPAHALSQLEGFCANTTGANVTAFDTQRRNAVAVLASGREPRGLAIDPAGRRLYVALAGQDQVQVIDLSNGEELRRLSLQPGDRPLELALAADGTLLVVNAGTASVSFFDPGAGALLERVPVGEAPESVLVDRDGRRAWVFNRRSSSMTVIDLSSRSVVSTAATDPEPLRGQLNRRGNRLYVIHGGSPYVQVFSVPELVLQDRIYVGLGASALKVDSSTDLIYVGNADERRVQVFDPASSLPVDWIDLPEPPAYLTIDHAANALIAVLPNRGALWLVDLTSRRALGAIDVGLEPTRVTLEGERR